MSSSCCNSNCDSSCCYSHFLHRVGEFFQPFLLLAIRLFWGYLLFETGSSKIADLAKTAAFFESVHIPFPALTSHIVGYIEIIGGICLMAGFATRLVSFLLIILLLVATFTAHNDLAFYAAPPFPFLVATATLFCFGPGLFSVDCILHKLFGRKTG